MSIKTLREQSLECRDRAFKLKSELFDITDRAEAENRDLTSVEERRVNGMIAEAESLKEQAAALSKQADQAASAKSLVERLTGPDVALGPDDHGRASWGKSVQERMQSAASGHGLKALLQGQIDTPPAVAVSALPDTPTRLLDLIAREQLEANTFAFLRQTVKDENAAVV
ncbi:hypothetical protein PU560_08970, partial [Georgenia sp. 10Sc9-8]|nr:hypothetical protein [Georgenia halotolerans]